ncbi:hypothetical protein LTR37_021236 [Vermiconidia calcicola]|uniref:Uncharacterized protein n=1 Tax=Vermiconidia calcicola TaxID=1690605 RepID=A0ACC3M9C6_9PEZI|nr:hypothetical protein LTR37_021236 [Vermiconidia calcicola]
MPEKLTESEVQKGQDPSSVKQWDNDVPLEKKFEDFAAIVDKLGVCMLGTARDGVGPVCRSMAVAKRTGPDFLFLSNADSQKFEELEGKSSIVSLSFQNNSNTDWVSVTGEAVTTSNDDPRIKEIHSKMVSAWFGNLGDGVHTGGPDDPRMKLIEIKATFISYWRTGALGGAGLAMEAVAAAATGTVATPGSLRQLTSEEIEQARSKYSSMSS